MIFWKKQVTVAVKHVRFKAENSKWDESHMGHFPTMVTLSVMPQAKEGSSVTMTNSSSNNTYKIGKAENISAGSGAGDGATRGVGAALRASAGVAVSSTMKATPWRFEQLPLKDDRGGSFVWTLQSMKGISFERSNPHRMAESSSNWKWGRRVPGNPLDQLPFTSEGGVIFTGSEFVDTMMWRFPKTMEGKKLRWSIEGQIHSTFTTSRYFETRVASFCGDIEEKLKPLEEKKDKDKDKGGEKSEKSEKKDKDKDKDGEKSEKKEKSEKSEKGDKSSKSEKDDKEGKKALTHLDTTLRTEFEEFLEFKKYREEQKKAKSAKIRTDTASNDLIELKEDNSKMQSISELPENAVFEDSEQQGMEKKPMNMKLELDDSPASLANRLSLPRAVGYNGRWLGSSDMEPLSPPIQPLHRILDEDFHKYPETPRSASVGNRSDRSEQRIKGLSVRSVRSSRMDPSDSQRER